MKKIALSKRVHDLAKTQIYRKTKDGGEVENKNQDGK